MNSIKSTWVAGGNEIGDSSFLQPSKLCHPLPGSCFVGIDLNSAIPKARAGHEGKVIQNSQYPSEGNERGVVAVVGKLISIIPY